MAHISTSPATQIPSWQALVAETFQRITTWSETARQRRALGALEPHLLRDIGVTPQAAANEAARPFWA